MGNKKKMQNISRHAEYCAALLGLHAFTSCGITRSFKCLGKVKVFEEVAEYAMFCSSLGKIRRQLASATRPDGCAGKPKNH